MLLAKYYWSDACVLKYSRNFTNTSSFKTLYYKTKLCFLSDFKEQRSCRTLNRIDQRLNRCNSVRQRVLKNVDFFLVNPLWGSSPRKHPVRKRQKDRLCFKSWSSPASNHRIRHTRKRQISSNKNCFQSCQSLLSLLGTIHFSELAITA